MEVVVKIHKAALLIGRGHHLQCKMHKTISAALKESTYLTAVVPVFAKPDSIRTPGATYPRLALALEPCIELLVEAPAVRFKLPRRHQLLLGPLHTAPCAICFVSAALQVCIPKGRQHTRDAAS